MSIETTPALLPTPTLAAITGTDPLRPPTPIVLPTPTTESDVPAELTAPMGAESPPASEEGLRSPTPTVALPSGATPAELFELGRRSAAEGDNVKAAAAFRAVLDEPGDLEDDVLAEVRLGLAVARLALGQTDAAAGELQTLVQAPDIRAGAAKGTQNIQPVTVQDAAAFHLGRARVALGNYAGAIEAYQAYLQRNPDMAAYIQPLIADAYLALDDRDAAIAALEGAVEAPAQRFKSVANRVRLAGYYLEGQNYPAAIAQYDAVHNIARTEATKGQMTYLAGQAEILAGNTEAGHERFLQGIADYPRAPESYQALIALIEAGVPVDAYQRGVVDYYAGAYQPGVEALRTHIAGGSTGDYNKDAHLFLAWSYERLGDLAGALDALDAFAEFEPARALFERGEMLRRAGRAEEALAAYDSYLADFPDAEGAAGVAWSAAVLADQSGQPDAVERYLFLADTFPFDPNTPAALSRAAELDEAAGDAAGALALRQRLIEQYPANVYGAEALFRLLRAATAGDIPDADLSALERLAASLSPTNYFALRAADLVAGNAPFTAGSPMNLPDSPDDGRAEAEAWLRERLADSAAPLPEGDLAVLSQELSGHPNRRIGEKLWQLGMLEEAKAELELVREENAGDPLANYQLASYFSELGLYRSSIIAASALLRQVNATVFDAPLYLGRLSYPVYYADLILPLSDQYGFDPRLQFALVRQESLFESFARSGAAAQGLSQVIPDTGAWIAQRLAWPDFQNEDLYKPFVGLHFGAYYLSEQLKNFDGQVHAALAAYNGGPGNAARWYQAAGQDFDLFVDTVDFPETRLYIERIYEGFNAYRHLYGQP